MPGVVYLCTHFLFKKVFSILYNTHTLLNYYTVKSTNIKLSDFSHLRVQTRVTMTQLKTHTSITPGRSSQSTPCPQPTTGPACSHLRVHRVRQGLSWLMSHLDGRVK